MYLSYECTIRYGILLRSDPASVNSNALQYFCVIRHAFEIVWLEWP